MRRLLTLVCHQSTYI